MSNRLYILLSMILLLLLYACGSSSSDNVLNFFFDGVQIPDSTSENSEQLAISDSVSSNQNKSVQKTVTPVLFFHVPYQEKSCNSCHNTGFSNKKVMELPDLCYQCHDDFGKAYTNLHYPVEEGECNSCHHPHQSKYNHLLLKPTGELCEECHDVDELLAGDLHEGIVKDECMDCHNPHGSNEDSLIR